MTYPTLPFALVSFLAQINKERAGLRRGPRHVTIAAHLDKSVRSRRFEVENNDHWTAVLQGAIALYSEGPLDTMAFIYPADGEDPVDIGVIIEKGKEPLVFQWTYAPAFAIHLVDEGPVVEQVKNGVGVQEVLGLMNREPAFRVPSQPAVHPAIAAPARQPEAVNT